VGEVSGAATTRSKLIDLDQNALNLNY
jgi:hypothetical protein